MHSENSTKKTPHTAGQQQQQQQLDDKVQSVTAGLVILHCTLMEQLEKLPNRRKSMQSQWKISECANIVDS